MSAENVATVRCIYDGWASGDLAQARSLIDADVEVHADPESPWPGIERVYNGRTGIARYLESICAAFERYDAQPKELIDVGDHALVLAIERGPDASAGRRLRSARARASGRQRQRPRAPRSTGTARASAEVGMTAR